MKCGVFKKGQRGSSIAEFALGASVFFMIIFGIIEFGRLLYTHNALTDATRRGARYAVLHPESIPCTQNAVAYGETHIGPAPDCLPAGPLLINGLTPDLVDVTYLGANLDADPELETDFGVNLGTVTVSIDQYVFDFNIPLLARDLPMPAYSVTLPAESAGVPPDDIVSP